jgi:hemerythrin
VKSFPLSNQEFVGDEFLDSQHALILSCMANVATYFSAETKGQDLFDLVDRLDAYCKLHFLEEEKVMERLDFAEMAAHKCQHALFVTHLEHFMGRNEEQNSNKNIEELNYITDLFLEHIALFEQMYSERKTCLGESALKSVH